jgi:tRNA A37 threonylcarbamoyladenosine dehydratase
MKVDLLGYEIELREKSGSSQPSSSPEIEHELLSRIQSFFGDQGLARIRDSFVIVVGLGGVGSHCAHMLGRSGVGKLRLIDFDQVTLSSLNRHAVATMKDVGISKVRAMKEHLQEIVPWCEIDAIQEMFVLEEAPRLLQGNPTFVVDCIDDLKTKAELIAFCLQNQLPVLTSLGAGGKADPTRLRIAPLSDCINDPLAQKLKWRIKKFNVLAEDVMSVFSIEKPVCNLLPLDDEQREKPQVIIISFV